MAGDSSRRKRRGRRTYSDELKTEAVQMVLNGHRADPCACRRRFLPIVILPFQAPASAR